MSYINEINGFHKWVQTHPELPTSARILWFTLMHYNNSCGWKRVFNVPISLLMGDSGLSRSSIVRARKLLQESGRIRYTTRSDMKATEYELLPMSNEPGIATGYDTDNTRHDTGRDTGCDKGYDKGYDKGHNIERDTLYDTWHDTKDDTAYDTPHDIVYDNAYDIAHDTQDGHIPRLDQTRQDQTNTIQDNQILYKTIKLDKTVFLNFLFQGVKKKKKKEKKMLTVRTTLICMVTPCMTMKCMMAPCMMKPCVTTPCMITKCMMIPCTTTTCVITKYMMTTCITTTYITTICATRK